MLRTAVLYTFQRIIIRLQGPSWPKSLQPPHIGPPSQGRSQLFLLSPSQDSHAVPIYEPAPSPKAMAPLRLNEPASLSTCLNTPHEQDSPHSDYIRSHHSLNPDNVTQLNPVNMPASINSISLSPGTNATSLQNKRGKGKGKGKIPPTRRSQRLQAKGMRSTNNMAYRSTPARDQKRQISFNCAPPETPLSIDTAPQILQATGLEITRHVEDMVKEAAQKDADTDLTLRTTQQPTTPLHDPIPPPPSQDSISNSRSFLSDKGKLQELK